MGEQKNEIVSSDHIIMLDQTNILISSYPHHDGTGPWYRGGFLVSHRRSKIDLKICLHNRYAHALRLDLHDQDAVDLVVVGNFNVVALGQSRKVAKCILQTIMEPKKERGKKEAMWRVVSVSIVLFLAIQVSFSSMILCLHCLGIANVQKVDALWLDLDKAAKRQSSALDGHQISF